MLKLASEQETINVVNDQIGTPTSTVDLTNCILEILKTDSYGTYHATNEGFCTWFDFANKIFEFKKINTVKVCPITTEQLSRPAKRPRYSVLDNFMLNLTGINKFRQWEDSLSEYLMKI